MANIFDRMKDNIKTNVQLAMTEVGDDVCENMRNQLQTDGHTGTGQLINDIGFDVTTQGDKVTVSVTMPAYGKYIDSGTGAAHGVSGGREGSWRYQDRQGNWHTTDGMDADPFIDKSVDATLENLSAIISEQVSAAIIKAQRGG